MVRKGKGRQKISIEKMKNESHLQVTFSKRRYGLFKKASELSILCGVKVGIIVYSPGQKVYSFGHPSIDNIINNYFNHKPNQIDVNPTFEALHNANLEGLNMDLTYVQNLLDMENVRGQYLKNMKKDLHAIYWWDVPNKDELSVEQLQYLKDMMENLQNEVTKVHQIIIMASQNTGNLSYQIVAPHVLPIDTQSNEFLSPLPLVTTIDGVGPNEKKSMPYEYRPGWF